ncbi:hypothetical protein PRIPAC_88846 [Pristionchus pacificus]|uniref:Uncharacterized protein n=1 Tax=Pristionchus pacificus TaxID=54126 RepID=A0A2A6CW03_PRIPA|nr:hypothetical protein PRIPAC_88846 [Pristionchus pacificus]|eukprot:PDM82223.1 hypothetical protein PRIPAC_36616 [Pristionchus pacificus]
MPTVRTIPEDWEPGPPFRVVESTDQYDKQFRHLDIEYTDKDGDKGVGAFAMPLVITICLIIAILLSLAYFFIRRSCFPNDHLPVDTEEPKQENNGKTPPA